MRKARIIIACLTGLAAMMLVALFLHKPVLAVRLVPFGIGMGIVCLTFFLIPEYPEGESRE